MNNIQLGKNVFEGNEDELSASQLLGDNLQPKCVDSTEGN